MKHFLKCIKRLSSKINDPDLCHKRNKLEHRIRKYYCHRASLLVYSVRLSTIVIYESSVVLRLFEGFQKRLNCCFFFLFRRLAISDDSRHCYFKVEYKLAVESNRINWREVVYCDTFFLFYMFLHFLWKHNPLSLVNPFVEKLLLASN